MLFSRNLENGRNKSKSSKTDAGMNRLINRFPEWQAQIKRLVYVSPDFRELCEDYEDVIQALDHWRQTSSPDSAKMIKEYEILLEYLEVEAEEYLRELST